MKFERRDAILLAGAALMALGVAPFIPLIYGILIAAGIFFGIKIYISRRQEQLRREIAKAACPKCGLPVGVLGCTHCDMP